MHGEGRIIVYDNDGQMILEYKGGFHKGFFHGQGTYKKSDGTHYTGDFVNSLRQGHGTMSAIQKEEQSYIP